jgi:hypothetical protein
MNNNTQIGVTDSQAIQDGGNNGHDASREQPQFCPRCGKVGHIANVYPTLWRALDAIRKDMLQEFV